MWENFKDNDIYYTSNGMDSLDKSILIAAPLFPPAFALVGGFAGFIAGGCLRFLDLMFSDGNLYPDLSFALTGAELGTYVGAIVGTISDIGVNGISFGELGKRYKAKAVKMAEKVLENTLSSVIQIEYHPAGNEEREQTSGFHTEQRGCPGVITQYVPEWIERSIDQDSVRLEQDKLKQIYDSSEQRYTQRFVAGKAMEIMILI